MNGPVIYVSGERHALLREAVKAGATESEVWAMAFGAPWPERLGRRSFGVAGGGNVTTILEMDAEIKTLRSALAEKQVLLDQCNTIRDALQSMVDAAVRLGVEYERKGASITATNAVAVAIARDEKVFRAELVRFVERMALRDVSGSAVFREDLDRDYPLIANAWRSHLAAERASAVSAEGVNP